MNGGVNRIQRNILDLHYENMRETNPPMKTTGQLALDFISYWIT